MYRTRIQNYWRQLNQISHSFAVIVSLILVFIGVISLFAATVQDPPGLVTVAGQIGGWGNGTAVKDDFVFVIQSNCLSSLKKEAQGLTRVGFLMLPEEAGNCVVSDDHLLFSFFDPGHLGIVDISDPSHLTSFFDINIDGITESTNEIWVADNFAYVISSNQFGTNRNPRLSVVDISDPATAHSVSTLEFDLSAFVTIGNYGYAILGNANSSSANQLAVFDLSDKTNIQEIKRIGSAYAERLGTDGTYLYVANNNSGGLKIYDVSNPQAPALFGQYQVGSSSVLDVDISDGYAYLKTGSKEITLVDVSQPSNPRYVSKYEFDFDYVFFLDAVSNTLAYIRHLGKFYVLDFSNPAIPDFKQAFFEPTEIRGHDIEGNHLYMVDDVIDSDDELLVYDLSVPAAPALIDSTAGIANANRVFAGNSLLVVADWMQGITLFDIADPNNPVQQGTYQAGATVIDTAFWDSYAYLLTSKDGTGTNYGSLECLDVSNPSNPVRVGRLLLPGNGQDQSLSDDGQWLFIAYSNSTGGNGFQIVDVSNPSNPVSVNQTNLDGAPKSVAAIDSLLIVASNIDVGGPSEHGVVDIFDISTRTNPAAVSTFTPSDTSTIYDLLLSEGMLFVALQPRGIFTYGLDTATAQVTPGPVADVLVPLSLVGYRPSPPPLSALSNEALRLADNPTQDDSYYLYSLKGYGYGTENYGSGGVEITRTGPKQCCITVEIQPEEAADAGCTASVTPAAGKCGTPVTLTTNPASGWLFDWYEGELVLLGEKPNCNIVIVHFKREPVATLTLGGGAGAQHYCPCDTSQLESVAILPISLSVDDIDSWIVRSVTFSSYGSGNEREDINEVRLYKGSPEGRLFDSKSFPADNSQITLSTDSYVIPAGGDLPLLVVYEFADTLCDSPDVLRDFSLKINITGVNADPEHVTGVKLPDPQIYMDGGPVFLGPGVWNADSAKHFNTIQQAIDDAETVDGHTIEVCPGTYNENVNVTKSLTIRSIEGRDVTIVQSVNANDDVFKLIKGHTTIEGFTIKGIPDGQKDGIYIHDGNEVEIANVKVSDNGGEGIFAASGDVFIRGENNEISNNGGAAVYSSEGSVYIEGKLTATYNNKDVSDPDGPAAIYAKKIEVDGDIDVLNDGASGLRAWDPERGTSVSILGSAKINNNTFMGIWAEYDVVVGDFGSTSEISNNGRGAIWSSEGDVYINGQLTANNNNKDLADPDGPAAIMGKKIKVDGDIEVSGNRGSGLRGHELGTSVSILGSAKINNNTFRGIWAEYDVVVGDFGSTSEISNNGRGAIWSSEGDVYINGQLTANNNNKDVSDPEGHAAIYAWKDVLVEGDIKVSNNRGSGIAGWGVDSSNKFSVDILGNAEIHDNTLHGIEGTSVQLAAGEIYRNNGYGIQSRSISLQRVRIYENQLGGIFIKSGSEQSNIYASTIVRCVIAANSGNGVRFEGGFPLTINQSNIYSNTGFGVNNLDSSQTINAQNNWWGDPDGPEGDSGDGVSDNVDFSNWLTSPATLNDAG
jgi:hypothetical protein